MGSQRCTECGAELRLETARCPLCGTDPAERHQARAVADVESYQSNVRSLREQLRQLREQAEAV
jgi:predicted amidophosphoribosyltransferase